MATSQVTTVGTEGQGHAVDFDGRYWVIIHPNGEHQSGFETEQEALDCIQRTVWNQLIAEREFIRGQVWGLKAALEWIRDETKGFDYLEDALERLSCEHNQIVTEGDLLQQQINEIIEDDKEDPTDAIRTIADPMMLSYGFEFNEIYEPEGDDDTIWEIEYEEDKPTESDSYDFYIHYDQGEIRISAVERRWSGGDRWIPQINTTMEDLANDLETYILNHCR